MRKPLIGVLVGAVAYLALSGVASAALSQTADIALSSSKADSSTGTKTSITATESDPSVLQPLAASNVVVNFPKGTVFNYKAAPVCSSSQAQQIQSTNGAVCKKALIGTGSATANVKPLLNTDVSLSIQAFNGQNKLYFYLLPQGGVGNPLLLTGSLRGTKLTTPVPRIEAVGGSGVFAVLTSFNLTTKARKSNGLTYTTTPKTCTGKWETTTNFTYIDGSTNTVSSDQPCKK